MKRRRFLRAAPTSAAAVLLPGYAAAQAPQPAPPQPQPQRPAQGASVAKLETAAPDDAGSPVAPRFFTAAQFATLKQLCAILQPPGKAAPGAIEAGVPEFLDFLVGESPAARKRDYRAGLDLLKGLDEANAASMLAPLKKPWTFEPSKDPLARFLQAAKQDIRNATQNSREWAKAASANAAGGRRGGGGGVGLYWNSLEEA